MLTTGQTSSSAKGDSIDRRERQDRFMRLYQPVQRRLEAFCFAMTRDDDEALDLVGETILRAYEHFAEIRDSEAFLSYLFTIASRVHKRKRWRGRLFGNFDPEYVDQMPYGGTAPDVSADVDRLYAALARLPDAQREAIVLFEISGMSVAEIKEIQGGSLSAVKMRLARARKALANLLGVEELLALPEPSVHATQQELPNQESHAYGFGASHE